MQTLLRKFDLFIFDWDGTLSTSGFLTVVRDSLKQRYKPWYIKEHMEEFRKENFEIQNIKIEAEEHKLYESIYDVYSTFVKTKLREGALETLQSLKNAKKKVAIFSDARPYRLKQETHSLNLSKYFDLVLCSELVDSYKPYPKGLNVIVKKMRAKKERSIYIGDMASDVITAQLAGITSCGVAGGVGTYVNLKEAGPDYLFESVEELARTIKTKI